MKKITNVNIDTNKSTLTFAVEHDNLSSLIPFVVYVDECENIDNIYSDSIDNHNYCFTFENSIITANEGVVTIKNTQIGEFDNHLKYIRLSSDSINLEGVYYNTASIYDAELTHIKKVCDTCLDNKCMLLIMYVTFKRQLLDSAIEAGLNKEAMSLYVDICKMLEITNSSNKCTTCEKNSSCITCANGYCTLK